MANYRTTYVLFALILLLVNLGKLNLAQEANRMATVKQLKYTPKQPKGPLIMCTQDSLIIYQDCRICVCSRPNRLAKCIKKNCDLRTKDSGQCPNALLRMDSKGCNMTQIVGCKVDGDCPGNQMCCFDFCGGPRCVDPVPLDSTTGLQVHGGRVYAKTYYKKI